ncbi:MAG: hydrolase [Candidatus Shapirobacteria bacterium]
MTTPMVNPDICCPEFIPKTLDDITHTWKDKLFLTGEVKQLFHIPLNMGSVITRMCSQIESAQASAPPSEFLLLAYDPSPWKSELYMTITKEVPGATSARLSGTFVSKVFDGPYNFVPKWIKEMDALLATKGQKALKYYFHYAYCPKCSKKYGHNYCVAFAQTA